MSSPGLLDWAAAAAAGPDVAGGKGWNLGRLWRYGFPVPAGFVIGAGGYRQALAAPGLARLAAEFAGVGPADAAAAAVADRLRYLRTAIEAAPLPAAVVEGVRRGLAAAGLEGGAVAVRSSATAEDGGSSSFAGVHLSRLDVRGADAVLRALREVWASLWTPQALAYRRRFLIPDAKLACAVVVCGMVPARCAGVAFTCDPRSGRRDVVAINAAPGLGEAVVSGAVNPQETSVALTPRGLEILSRTGPEVLDRDAAPALARLALRVQAALGDSQDPQDIEWAWDGTRFHLLQARPVTRAPRVSLPGAAHLPVIWSNANIKDAVPFVMTAMTWSCVLPSLRFMLWTYPRRSGYPAPDGMEVARRFAGRGYFDAGSLQWAMFDAFGVPPADINRGTGGHQAEIPVPPGNPLSGRRGLQRRLRLLRGGRILMSLPKFVPGEIGRVFRQARELNALDLPPLSNAALLGVLEKISLLQASYGEPFMLASSALAWQSELERVIERIAPGRGVALGSALVAGAGGVASAEQGTRLFDVADAARRDPAALDLLRRDPLDPAAWRTLPAESPFRTEFERFLADFGHRAVYEAEVATPRWNEDPRWLLEQVRAILDGQGRRPEEGARARRQEAEAEIRRRTWWRRWPIFWLARRAREGAQLRERAKSALVAQVEPMRRALLETGRRMAAAGCLEAPADVFHLAWGDVEAWLRGDWDGRGARELAADRREQMRRWEQERPPDVIAGDGAGAPADTGAAVPAPKGARRLTGLAVSGGRAAGPARLVRHPHEGHRLRPGDVLVAPSTDPGWTPLFLRASAVVMEIGGVLSHGAIVAREYGLPAVVNIPGLLERVQDGDALVVDGDAGVVERTPRSESPAPTD